MNLNQQCLLCGKHAPTGLNVMGCLICFECEKKLTSSTTPPPPKERIKLMRLYEPKQKAVSF